MSIMVNLAHVISIAGNPSSGVVSIVIADASGADKTERMPSKDVRVYGEGEMLVTRWLAEVAGDKEGE